MGRSYCDSSMLDMSGKETPRYRASHSWPWFGENMWLGSSESSGWGLEWEALVEGSRGPVIDALLLRRSGSVLGGATPKNTPLSEPCTVYVSDTSHWVACLGIKEFFWEIYAQQIGAHDGKGPCRGAVQGRKASVDTRIPYTPEYQPHRVDTAGIIGAYVGGHA